MLEEIKGNTTVSRRARSGRSSVTVKKKLSAETVLLMLGGCMPLCVWCSWKRRRSSAGVARLLAEPANDHASIMRARSALTGRGEEAEVIGAPLWS